MSEKKVPKILEVVIFLGLGALFGFLLSRAGATTYRFYYQLFLFEDLQLLWVIGVAAAVGIAGVFILRFLKARNLLTGDKINPGGKPYKKELIPGSLLFGLGWGFVGACPGTALAMLGEGKLASVFVISGFFLGTYAYGLVKSKGS